MSANPYEALLATEEQRVGQADVAATGATPTAPPAPPVRPIPQPAANTNPYDDLLAEADAAMATRQRAVLRSAVGTNPDQAGEAARLARRYPAPADVVLRNLSDVRLQAAVDDADARLKTSPKLAEYMRTSPFTAKQAYDDIQTLASIESGIGSLTAAGLAQATLGVAESVWRTPDTLRRGLNLGVQGQRDAGMPLHPIVSAMQALLGFSAPAFTQGADKIRSAQKVLTDRSTFGDAFADLNLLGQNADVALKAALDGQGKPIAQVVADPRYWSAFISQAAPSLLAAYMSGGSIPFMAWMEGMGQSNSAAEFEKRTGQKISDADFAQSFAQAAVINALLEKAGLDKVVGAQGKGLAGIIKAALTEGGTEALQQFNSNLAQKVTYDPGQALGEGVLSSFMGGAGSGGGGASLGVGVEKLGQKVQARSEQRQQAEQAAEAAQALMDAAGLSKLRERNPEEFRSLIENMGEGAEIFVDAEVLNQLPLDAQQQMHIEEQMPAALASGGSVSLKVSDVLTYAPGTPIADTILQNARLTADGVSLAEATQAGEKAQEWIQEQAAQVIAAATDQQAAQASSDAVRQQVLDELNNAGRFRPAVNEQYASFVAAFYTTMAGRAGLSAQEFAAKYPLRVVSTLAQEQALNQGEGLDAVLTGWDEAGIKHSVSEKDGTIEVGRIIVPDGEREQGKGTAAMKRLLDYADATGQRVVLTPSGDFGGSKGRLEKFYKGLGFKPNKGRAKDFTTMAGMIREPSPSILKQGARGTFSPNRLEIALGANADLSTFLHETGHFFLEVMADVASQPDAPADVLQDMGTVMQWFGVQDLATWQGMTLKQQRPMHERFAESFEQYLMEGRAPSPELAPFFRRFRAWLTNVYRSVQNFLGGNGSADSKIQLSDEVRQVFDRMLASEEQIKQAEEVAGLVPDEEATARAVEKLTARSLRDLKWTVGARGRAIKALQAEAKETRAAVQAEITEEIDALPVVKAKEALDALQVNPDFVAASDDWKARRQAALEQTRTDIKDRLVAAEGPDLVGLKKGQFLAKNKRLIENQAQAAVLEWEKANPKPVRSQNATDADLEVVADSFGFDSADAMLQAVDAFGSKADVIQAMTDQRMLQEHGDLIDQQAIEQAANEAVHNQARARALATELKTQAEALNERQDTGKTTADGRKITVNALMEAAKQFGANIVERTLMRDMRSKAAQHLAAERRAAAKWLAATKAGKTVEAIKAKQDQVLNHAAARATMEAAASARKDLEYLKKFDKPGVRSRLAQDYVDQIDQLLEAVDLRQTSNAALAKRVALREWAQNQEDLGLPVSIPDSLLEEANRKSWKEMTAAEFDDLVDAVKNIEHLGRLKNRLLTLKDKRAFDQIVGQWVDTIVENGGKPLPVELEGRGRFKAMVQGFATSHRKIASLMRQWTGGKDGGPLWDAFVRPMNEAANAEAVMIEKAAIDLAAIYKPVLDLPGGLDGDKQFIPEINASLSRGGRLAVALNMGNAQNRQRLKGGDNWTDAQLGAIVSRLTPVEAQFINDTWAYLDSYWPLIKAKQERVSGVVEKKVAAEPFALNLADGTTVQMRGGYYPIKYDADRSGKADSQEAAEVAKDMMRGAFTKATTRRGHTKARVAEVNRAVRKNLDVITQHVTQVVHDLAWHEWIIDANRLIGNKSIEAALREHYGPDVIRTIKSDIEGIATADVVAQTALESGLLMLRRNASRSIMAFSFTTALLQPFGLTQSMARVGVKHVLLGAKAWAGDAMHFESSLRKVGEKSDFMRLRAKTMNRELTEINQRVQGRSPTLITVDRGLFWLTTKMQLVADVPTWLGAYEKALGEGLDDATAVARADQAVLDSQGGGQIKDLAEVQRKHPMLTQFYSYFSVTLNLMAEKTATTDFKNPRAVAGWLGDMALLAVIPAIVPNLLAYMLKGGDDDDPEEWAKRIARWQLSYLLGLGVGVRELSGAVEGFDYSGLPVARVIVDIGKAAQQTAQGEVDEPAVMAYIRLLGSLFGIPTVQAIRSYKGWVAWEEGDAPPSSILFGPPPRD